LSGDAELGRREGQYNDMAIAKCPVGSFFGLGSGFLVENETNFV
jgi:hypothetical protein